VDEERGLGDRRDRGLIEADRFAAGGERRPVRALDVGAQRARQAFLEHLGDLDRLHLDADGGSSLVTLTVALTDGLFIASEADDVALAQAFDLMARAIFGVRNSCATRTESLRLAARGVAHVAGRAPNQTQA
jgi:hypothetical protein